MKEKKRELLKPRYDVVFQALFQNNKENITESLISDILGEKVKIIEIKTDDTLLKEYPDEKVGRLDLKTVFKDGTICQIEMQLANERNIVDRVLYYWSKTFSTQLKRGEPFKHLVKTIGIVITDFEIKEMEGIEKLSTKWQIMETEEGKKILTNKLELRIIEIPKANRILEQEGNNKIAQWITFIDNPNTERVEKIMKENKEVKKARDVLYVMSEDEKLQRLAFLKERAIMEENSLHEQWKEDGLAEGRKKGIIEGRIEGKNQEKRETAKRMKNKGFSLKEIVEITGLSKEEIEEIE